MPGDARGRFRGRCAGFQPKAQARHQALDIGEAAAFAGLDVLQAETPGMIVIAFLPGAQQAGAAARGQVRGQVEIAHGASFLWYTYAILSLFREQIVNTETPAATLRLTLLGSYEAALAGQPVRGFVSAKAQALLAYLALAGRPCPRAELAALLWGEMPDAASQTNLRKALSNLHQLFGPHLCITRHEAALNPAAEHWVDAVAFQEEGLALLRRSEVAPGPADDRALARLAACAQLYRGEFLAGLAVVAGEAFEDWLVVQREQLHTVATRLLSLLAAQLAGRGRYGEALATSARLLALEPWNEDAHRQRMLLLACDGQRGAALRQYELCRRTLAAEFGVAPAAETEAIHQRLVSAEATPPDALPLTAGRLPFVGREAEHAWLLARWQAAQRGRGGLTLVAGEAGAGKTRLVQQVLQPIAMQGGVVLTGRCYEFNRAVPFQAFHGAVQGYLAQLPPATRPDLSADLLFDMERVVSAAQRTWPGGVTLFLDDLQWADADTLDLLHYLVRRLARGPCWLVGAYRPEATPADHPLPRLCESLARDGLLFTLALPLLSQEAVTRLVSELLGPGAPAELGEQVYRESEGNPFLINELTALWQGQELPAAPEGEIWEARLAALSEQAREVIARRVQRLDETSRYLLTLAAVYGQPFDRELLAAAGACPPEAAARAVAEGTARRLLRPAADDTVDFAHDRVRAALYHAVPAPARQLIHERLAVTLAARRPDAAGQPADLLAHHFDRAQAWPQALRYLRLAGDRAMRAQAHDQALECYKRGLAIVRQHRPAGGDEFAWLSDLEALYELQARRAEQHAALTDMARLAGLDGDAAAPGARDLPRQVEVRLRQSRYAEAVGDYRGAERAAQAAVALAEEAAQPALAAAGCRLWAYAVRRQQRLAEAWELYQTARQIAEAAAAVGVLADSLQGLANVARDRGQYEEAQAYAAQSLALCRTNNDRRGEGDVYNIMGLTCLAAGDHAGARAGFEHSLAIRRAIGDRRGMALALNNLGRLALERGDCLAARAAYSEALDLSQSSGDRYGQAFAHYGLYQTLLAEGQHEAAARHAWESLRFHRLIGRRAQARALLQELRQLARAPAQA